MSKTVSKTLTRLSSLFIGGLFTSNVFAHTGFHNEIYHPMSGVDHFLVVLAIGVITGIAIYCYKK